MLWAVFLGPRTGLLLLESSLEEAEVWRRCGGGGEQEDRGEDGVEELSDDFLLRLLRAGYLRSWVVFDGSEGAGRPVLTVWLCSGMLRFSCGVENKGLVSFTPSLPNTTSSSPRVAPSVAPRLGLMTGIVAKSGLSRNSDLRKKSDSGDPATFSQEVQSSPELGKEKPEKIGEMGEPFSGDGAESLVNSAALQSSMEL